MKFLISSLIFAFSMQANALTKYDHVKQLFDTAKTPRSIDELKKRLANKLTCAEFANSSQDESTNESLLIVTYTQPAQGPEFPAKTYQGIGFSKADNRPELFIKNSKTELTSQGVQISYEYSYKVWPDYDCGMGRRQPRCHTETVEVKGEALLRASAKYVLYTKGNGASYGYCW